MRVRLPINENDNDHLRLIQLLPKGLPGRNPKGSAGRRLGAGAMILELAVLGMKQKDGVETQTANEIRGDVKTITNVTVDVDSNPKSTIGSMEF